VGIDGGQGDGRSPVTATSRTPKPRACGNRHSSGAPSGLVVVTFHRIRLLSYRRVEGGAVAREYQRMAMANGHDLSYLDSGHGPAVLFIHGLASSGSSWPVHE
jgi:hypothetical protein